MCEMYEYITQGNDGKNLENEDTTRRQKKSFYARNNLEGYNENIIVKKTKLIFRY